MVFTEPIGRLISFGGEVAIELLKMVKDAILKPLAALAQGTRGYDFLYKRGRFNTHQIAAGATGPLVRNRLLYRVDTSFDDAGAWRGAGARRFNATPG